MKKSLLCAFCLGALAACAPRPEPELPPAAEGMSEAAAEAEVARLFFDAGCELSLGDYMDLLDAEGYDPELHDITTPEGHLAMINRVILESTPMLMAEGDQFTRSGALLTSHIGGCADAAPTTS